MDAVAALDGGAAWIATPAVRERVRARLPFPEAPSLEAVPADAHTLVVVGGGTLIDRVKAWRFRERPALRLVAVASLWGSGAEASPIAVVNGPAGKEITVHPRVRPDARAEWPELGADVPPAMARAACGDTYAHALEALLSPIAAAPIREQAAAVLQEAFILPRAYDPRWYELSARACALQAASSVGLIHGIAHALEPALAAAGTPAGHAALCATYALPVLDYNLSSSEKPARVLAQFGVEVPALRAALRPLHDETRYRAWLAPLTAAWPSVLRDPCTRTNAALVRPTALAFFEQWSPTSG